MAHEKRIVVTVTLDQNADGTREWHISQLGHAGIGGEVYNEIDGPKSDAMARDLGQELVKLLGPEYA